MLFKTTNQSRLKLEGVFLKPLSCLKGANYEY